MNTQETPSIPNGVKTVEFECLFCGTELKGYWKTGTTTNTIQIPPCPKCCVAISSIKIRGPSNA